MSLSTLSCIKVINNATLGGHPYVFVELGTSCLLPLLCVSRIWATPPRLPDGRHRRRPQSPPPAPPLCFFPQHHQMTPSGKAHAADGGGRMLFFFSRSSLPVRRRRLTAQGAPYRQLVDSSGVHGGYPHFPCQVRWTSSPPIRACDLIAAEDGSEVDYIASMFMRVF